MPAKRKAKNTKKSIRGKKGGQTQSKNNALWRPSDDIVGTVGEKLSDRIQDIRHRAENKNLIL